MTTDEIRAALERHAKLRFPQIRGLDVADKIEALETHLVDTAIAVGELEEARMHVHVALNRLLDEWDDIQGWETFLPSSGRITQDDIRRAKKVVRPDLHAGINDGKRLAARLSEQIDRLGGMGEEKVASRLYTLLTGTS